MLLLSSLAVSRCESHCDNPCAELNGNVQAECGGCSAAVAACHSDAADFARDPAERADDLAERVGASVSALGHAVASPAGVPRTVRLIYAQASGPIKLSFRCDSAGASGVARDFGGDSGVRTIYRLAAGGWGYQEGTGPVHEFELEVQRRMTSLCAANAEDPHVTTERWPSCLVGRTAGAERTMHNASCRLARHRAAYGEHFLPDSSTDAAGSSTDAERRGRKFGSLQREAGQATAVAEVQGCLAPLPLLTKYVYASRPVVMRGCISAMPAMSRWTDKYLGDVAGGWHGNALLADDNITLARYLERYHEHAFPYVVRVLLPERLRADVTLPPPLRCTPLVRAVHGLAMWLSEGGHEAAMHFDAGDFFVGQRA